VSEVEEVKQYFKLWEKINRIARRIDEITEKEVTTIASEHNIALSYFDSDIHLYRWDREKDEIDVRVVVTVKIKHAEGIDFRHFCDAMLNRGYVFWFIIDNEYIKFLATREKSEELISEAAK